MKIEVFNADRCLFGIDISCFDNIDLDPYNTPASTCHDEEVINITSSPVTSEYCPPPPKGPPNEVIRVTSPFADSDEPMPCGNSAEYYCQQAEAVASIQPPFCDSDELMPTECDQPKNPPGEVASMEFASPTPTDYDESSYCPPEISPFVMLANFLRKEERSQLLNSSFKKLSQIKDTDSCLRRFLLVNNVVKGVQREINEEYVQPQQYYDNDNMWTKKSGVQRETSEEYSYMQQQQYYDNDNQWNKNNESLNNQSASNGCDGLMDVDLDDIIDSLIDSLNDVENLPPVTETGNNEVNCQISPGKRLFKDMENSNEEDVFSQFDLPSSDGMEWDHLGNDEMDIYL